MTRRFQFSKRSWRQRFRRVSVAPYPHRDVSLSDPSLSNVPPILSPLPYRQTPEAERGRGGHCNRPRRAGVSPHLTLQALREHLGEFLGEDAVAEKFLYLKCIGNNLAVVKAKQESELKLKSFAPPYNYLIIQITEVQHAIDQLKRKLDTDKMNLIIEVKMRKQAISNVRTLKAELAQNKINTSLQPQVGTLI
ncbi:Spermatogenesis-associated protein 1 [Pteropus alecto]|uniref:Spermatogenesis-associated protein 1 n=1 Tax=Pteropus alecto TaxID=9402 RepID=L5K3K0_PTEAL|nr:Spermatogenesis-associated protein 1 [Pteropus alecto]